MISSSFSYCYLGCISYYTITITRCPGSFENNCGQKKGIKRGFKLPSEGGGLMIIHRVAWESNMTRLTTITVSNIGMTFCLDNKY